MRLTPIASRGCDLSFSGSPRVDDPSFVPEAHRQLTELQYDEANEAEEVEKWIESHVDEVLFGEDSR